MKIFYIVVFLTILPSCASFHGPRSLPSIISVDGKRITPQDIDSSYVGKYLTYECSTTRKYLFAFIPFFDEEFNVDIYQVAVNEAATSTPGMFAILNPFTEEEFSLIIPFLYASKRVTLKGFPILTGTRPKE
jgi:hypothetical protein